jgi:hypothetical protein
MTYSVYGILILSLDITSFIPSFMLVVVKRPLILILISGSTVVLEFSTLYKAPSDVLR